MGEKTCLNYHISTSESKSKNFFLNISTDVQQTHRDKSIMEGPEVASVDNVIPFWYVIVSECLLSFISVFFVFQCSLITNVMLCPRMAPGSCCANDVLRLCRSNESAAAPRGLSFSLNVL